MRLRIGHKTYTVYAMGKDLVEKENANGIIYIDKSTIGLNPELSPEEQARVLIHEIIHALYEAAGRGDGARMAEEDVCRTLDRGFASMFQANPEVFGVLHQALSNGKAVVTETPVSSPTGPCGDGYSQFYQKLSA